MLTLIQYPAAFGSSSASPFCTKVEILLKMSGLDYTTEDLSDARKMPHAKLPVLRDGHKLIPDSVCIRRHLESKHGVDFDRVLGKKDLALSHAFTRLCEERLYWVMLYSRWMDDANWEIIKQHFFAEIPWPGRVIVPGIVRKQVRQALKAQGVGSHSPDKIYSFGIEDLESISTFLGDKAFLMGDEVSSVDATVYALLEGILMAPFPSPLKAAAEKMSGFSGYCERMHDRFLK